MVLEGEERLRLAQREAEAELGAMREGTRRAQEAAAQALEAAARDKAPTVAETEARSRIAGLQDCRCLLHNFQEQTARESSLATSH